jgi:hypothetical protein
MCGAESQIPRTKNPSDAVWRFSSSTRSHLKRPLLLTSSRSSFCLRAVLPFKKGLDQLRHIRLLAVPIFKGFDGSITIGGLQFTD